MVEKMIAKRERERCAVIINERDRRIAELEAAIREMILAIPGGQSCDPQRVADALRAIAQQNGITVG